MSCSNSTAPINITTNYKSTCDRLCKFNYDYPQSSCSVLNNGSYLKISYENSSTPSVIFNNVEMSVDEIRLYRPSLHQYNGNNADAELLFNFIPLHNVSKAIDAALLFNSRLLRNKGNDADVTLLCGSTT